MEGPLLPRLPAQTLRLMLAVLLGVVTLTSCADAAYPPPAAAPATATPPSPGPTQAVSSPGPTVAPTRATSPAVREVGVTVAGGRVSPPPGRVAVPRGERVRITVTSDRPDELHVHGYEEEVALPAGRPGSVEFVADQVGLFEVETHESGQVLLQLLVR